MSAAASSRLAPFAVACLGIALFSCMDAIMKGLSIAIGAYNAMFWRSIAGVLLTAPLFLLMERRVPHRRTLWLHLWRGLAAASSILLFFWGLARTPMAQGIALSFIAPLIALGLAAAFLKERIGSRALTGSIFAFAGVIVILISRAGENSSPDAMAGAGAILIAALSRRLSQAAGPMEVAFAFNLIALALYSTAAPVLAVVPDKSHLLTIIMAAISSSISLMLLAWAYARAEAQYLVSVEYTAFIWAALLGWLMFDERLTLATFAGAAMIVAGCLWAARNRADIPPVSSVDPEACA